MKTRVAKVKVLGMWTTYRFAEENNVGLDQPFAAVTSCDLFLKDMLLHTFIVERRFAVNTALGGETPVSLNDLFVRNTGAPFERVDVLREAFEE
jgi:hypothetical protein